MRYGRRKANYSVVSDRERLRYRIWKVPRMRTSGAANTAFRTLDFNTGWNTGLRMLDCIMLVTIGSFLLRHEMVDKGSWSPSQEPTVVGLGRQHYAVSADDGFLFTTTCN